MNTSESQLSSELQELYLENKDKLSDISYLEGETRFFQKLLEKILHSSIIGEKFHEIELVNLDLIELKTRREKVRELVEYQQHTIEAALKDLMTKINLSLVERNTSITNEIKSLMKFDRQVKQEIFTLVEVLFNKEKGEHVLNA